MAQGGPYTDPRSVDLPGALPIEDPTLQQQGPLVSPMPGDGLGEYSDGFQNPLGLQDPYGSQVKSASQQQQQPQPGLSNETVDALTEPRNRGGGGRGGGGRGGGISMDGGGYGWAVGASDFNPNGYKPNESRSTQVGKYGGSPLFAATLGMPAGAIASAMQRNAQKQDEIRKAVEKFDPMAGVEDVNAPEYRESYQRAAMDDIHGYIANVKEQYGDRRGMELLMDPTSRESKGIREKSMHWTTIARKMNQATGAADVVINNKDGERYVTKELLEQAKSIRYRLGESAGEQDVEKLAKDMTTLVANVSLAKLVKDDGVAALIKNAGMTSKFYEQIRSGELYDPRFRTLVGNKNVDRNAVIDSLTDYYYESRPTEDLTKAQIKSYFQGIVPQEQEQDVKMDEISKGGGGGGSSNDPRKDKYAVSMNPLPSSLYEGKVSPTTGKPLNEKIKGDWPTIHVYDFVSKQGRTPVAREFNNNLDKNKAYMHADGIVNVEGVLFIVGKITGQQRTGKVADGEEKDAGGLTEKIDMKNAVAKAEGGGSGGRSEIGVDEFNLLKDELIPYKGNEKRIETYFGLSEEGINKAFGIDPSRKQAPSFQTDESKSKDPEESAVKAAYPGAWKDPTHGWVAVDPSTGKPRKINMK